MPVTNLVWLTSASGSFTAENKAAMAAAFDAQANWVARNVPSASFDRELRGVALFQQIEDPRVVIETAHWSSSDEHNEWLASEEYKASSAPLGAHFDLGKLEYFHLDTDAFRPGTGTQSLLDSPVISVNRTRLPADKKNEILKIWDSRKTVLEESVKPGTVRFGFRIQKSDQAAEEVIVFAGWASVEKHVEAERLPGLAGYRESVKAIATSFDVKHYRRVL
ncbi:hypothetical protein GGS21DRAFT_379721 [Xylaria nigripes]|nr:hypothetical protein GGS21DRAFT_379721 [Xylaria nigripes]